jgi:hypothetical protein
MLYNLNNPILLTGIKYFRSKERKTQTQIYFSVIGNNIKYIETYLKVRDNPFADTPARDY